VKTQIWLAVSVYVLVAIIRKRLMLPISLYQILQILSVTRFEKTPILQALQPSGLPRQFARLFQSVESVHLIAGQQWFPVGQCPRKVKRVERQI
jgi:hypothetical protein